MSILVSYYYLNSCLLQDLLQCSFTLPYRVWSSIVIVHEKSVFLASFFRNISKTAETILIKKIGRNHGISNYKKVLISEHRKNYIFRDSNCFVKMSVSLLVCAIAIFVDDLAQKPVWISKPNFTHSFGALKLRAD